MGRSTNENKRSNGHGRERHGKNPAFAKEGEGVGERQQQERPGTVTVPSLPSSVDGSIGSRYSDSVSVSVYGKSSYTSSNSNGFKNVDNCERSRNARRMKRMPQQLHPDVKIELRQACRKAALKAEATWDRQHQQHMARRVFDMEGQAMGTCGSNNQDEDKRTDSDGVMHESKRSRATAILAAAPEQDPRTIPLRSHEPGGNGSTGNSDFDDLPPDVDEHSESSFFSHERAIRRGLQRGGDENNERNENDLDSIDELMSIDYELTTVSDSHIHRRGRRNPFALRGWRKLNRNKPRSLNGNEQRMQTKKSYRSDFSRQGSKASSIIFKKNRKPQPKVRMAREAWMCGVCAKSFSTVEAAERHEDYHIKEVVLDLGWINDSAITAECDARGMHAVGSGVGQVTPKSGFSSAPASFFQAPASPRQSSNADTDGKPVNGGATPFITPATKASQPRPDRIISSRKPPPPQCLVKRFNASSLFHSNDNMPRVSFHHNLVASSAPLRVRNPKRRNDDGTTGGETAALTTNSGVNRHMRSIAEDRTMEINNRSSPQQMSNRPAARQFLDPDRNINEDYVLLVDEALIDVCQKAEPWILTTSEVEAHDKLRYLAMDKAYYDMLANRALDRRRDGDYARFRAEGKTLMSKVQNKFVDAYQLIKQGGDDANLQPHDHYASKNRRQKKRSEENAGDIHGNLSHTDDTIYINVVVKNSIQLVRHELERLANQRWEDSHNSSQKVADDGNSSDHGSVSSQVRADTSRKLHARQQELFQKFRAAAQGHLVNLAGIALASDFTPRRIAVQLSNDLYRQLTPRLKKRGVTVATEIEYRVGPYFVLAVNVKQIDWARVITFAHRGVVARRKKWKRDAGEHDANGDNQHQSQGVVLAFCQSILRLSRMTYHEILAQFLSWMYYCHWIVYLPICEFLYRCCFGSVFRTYFLASVADDIFSYVESKGMEMDIGVRTAPSQAGAMLSALREIRDGRSQQKNTDDSKLTKGAKALLGPLLGPAIPADKGPAPTPPEGFEMPVNLEFVGLDIDLPVGFRRLRWALLHSKSTFVSDAIFRAESNYDNITMGNWSVHDEHIGSPNPPPDGVKESNFVGAEKTNSYLMPKSAFVKANMCTETIYIDVYNDYCLCFRKKALTPDVPYGSTFVAWTKYVIINTGNNTCKMTASVEAEFPNGEPMIGRQIRGGMRTGVTELFVTIGETITKYADEYP